MEITKAGQDIPWKCFKCFKIKMFQNPCWGNRKNILPKDVCLLSSQNMFSNIPNSEIWNIDTILFDKYLIYKIFMNTNAQLQRRYFKMTVSQKQYMLRSWVRSQNEWKIEIFDLLFHRKCVTYVMSDYWY